MKKISKRSSLFKALFIVSSIIALLAIILCAYELSVITQRDNSNKNLNNTILSLNSSQAKVNTEYSNLFEAVLDNNSSDVASEQSTACSKQYTDYTNASKSVNINQNDELTQLNNSPVGIALTKCVISADSLYMDDYIQKGEDSVTQFNNLNNIIQQTIN